MAASVVGVLLPVGFAIFVWWFSTGIVLMLDGLPRTTFRWSHLISTLIALAAYVGLVHTAPQTTAAGAFCAFTCALLVWGWHELSFLTGWITGPRRRAADPGVHGWPRFRQATEALLWHELAILASGLAIVAVTWGQANQVGTHTFFVLWVMRISAKLNIFLGVRNLSAQLLPPQIAYLASYFRQRPINPLFSFSVIGATAVATERTMQALAAVPGSAAHAGGLLVVTLLALAILEHWLLVLPLDATAPWAWAIRGRDGAAARLTPTDRTPHDEKLLRVR